MLAELVMLVALLGVLLVAGVLGLREQRERQRQGELERRRAEALAAVRTMDWQGIAVAISDVFKASVFTVEQASRSIERFALQVELGQAKQDMLRYLFVPDDRWAKALLRMQRARDRLAELDELV